MDTKVTDNDNTSEIAVDDRMDTKVTDNDNTSDSSNILYK